MGQKNRKKQVKTGSITTVSWTDKANTFCEHNEKIVVFLIMLAGLLMCILLFDVKMNLNSGDDSDYLIFAEDFWHHFTYPSYHGALYSIVISPIVGLFGYKIILLKSISCLFMLAFLWFFYKSFRGKVPATLLFPTLLLISINSFIFYYASQTFSEALFMFVQAFFFFYFFTRFVEQKDTNLNLKTSWKKYILLGCFILLMGLTRTIGYGAIGALILFFAAERRWKELIYSTIAFFAVFGLFQLLKYAIWPNAGTAYNLNTFFAKDFYNPIEKESLSGFINRFFLNSQTYLSNFLCQFLGVIKDHPSTYIDMDIPRVILLYLFYFSSIVILFKKNKPLLLSGIYVGIMLFVSFIILHTIWGQDRLIMVFYPYILIFLLGGIYYLFQTKTLRKFFFLYPLILIILCIGTFSFTQKRVEKNIPVLQENLLGDPFYGLTPDLVNFINGSRWAAQNLDQNALIVSRKPSISKVYSGRDFIWLPTDVSVSYDSLMRTQNTNDQTIIIVDKILPNPYLKYVINFRAQFPFNETTITGALVYIIPNSELEASMLFIQDQQIEYLFDYSSLFENMRQVEYRIYNPDMMLNYLIDNNIRYLLLPQLRVDPTLNTGLYINNTHRFIWFISYKYPNRFRLIHTEGKEEPCEIVEFLR